MRWPERNAADLDGYRCIGTKPNSIDGLTANICSSASRSTASSKPGATSRIKARPKYLCLYSTATFDVLDSSAYRTALANPTDWSKKILARFKNMIRAIRAHHGQPRNGPRCSACIVRLRPAGDTDKLRTALRDQLDPEKVDGILSMHLIESDSALSRPIADDPPVSDPGSGDWFVLIDGSDCEGCFRRPRRRLSRTTC